MYCLKGYLHGIITLGDGGGTDALASDVLPVFTIHIIPNNF